MVALAYLAAASYCVLALGIRDAEPYMVALIATNVVFALVAVAASPVTRHAWSARLARTLYRHGAYVTAIAALTGVLFGIDVIFMNHWAVPADVGVYSVYNGFPKRLLGAVFTDGIGLVLLPMMATMNKPLLMRRITRLAPAVAGVTAVVSFAASTVFFLRWRRVPVLAGVDGTVGGGHRPAHGVQPVLRRPVDGRRPGREGAHRLPGHGDAVRAGLLAACVRWYGLAGGLVGFALANLILLAVVAVTAARIYQPTEAVT